MADTAVLGESWWCVNWKVPGCMSRCCPQQERSPYPHPLKCAFSFLNCVHARSPRLRTRGAGRGRRSHSSGTQSLGHLSWADQHPSLGPVRDLLSGLPSSCLLRRPLPGPAPGSGYLGAQPTTVRAPCATFLSTGDPGLECKVSLMHVLWGLWQLWSPQAYLKTFWGDPGLISKMGVWNVLIRIK